MVASTFTVEETSSTQPMKIELRGRALPYQPFTLEGKMRAEFTWYAGSAFASAQMLGAEESASTVNGFWKDRFLKSADAITAQFIEPSAIGLVNGEQVVDAKALVDSFDKMRLRGQTLRVSWDAIVRVGILTRVKQTWRRREDVEWELEFQWISRGEVPTAVTYPLTPAAQDFAAAIKPLMDKLNLITARFPVVENFLSALDGARTLMTEAMDSIEAAASQVQDQVQTPFWAAERTLASAETLGQQGASIVTLVEETPALVVRKWSSLGAAQEASYGTAIEADEYTRELKATAKAIAYVSAEKAHQLRALIDEDDLLGTFIAPDDTDLRTVSQQYYGTPDQWQRLRTFNSLNSSKLTAGMVILVPKFQKAAGATINARTRTG